MTATTEPILPAGTRLAHYEIERVLGSGAMGTVYLAHDTALDRPVAVKVLRARLAEEASVVDRFVREARAAARVNHPNLTHIYFVGAEQGCRFFAMEYVPGNTFEQEIAAAGPMPLARFVDVLTQSARGLAAAHGAGVVHRDVKPSNLMLLPDGTVKVTDFGLAKSLGGDVGASGGGSLVGTPTYMSPEQCRGRSGDERTDVYALGLTAWFLLAGRAPFTSDSLGQMLQDQMNTPLPSIRDLRPELPPGIDRVLARMCDKDPGKRPGTMDEVAAAFEPFRPRPLELATFAARAFASACDLGIIAAAAAVVSVALSMLEHWIGVDVLPNEIWFFFFALALLVSQFGSEAWLSSTPGKWLFNLEVVRADGASPRRTARFMRFLIRYPIFAVLIVPHVPKVIVLSFVGLQIASFLAAAICFAARGRRTLSDLLTNTRVVHRPTPAAKLTA